MRYFIELAYNGKNYHGWQIQPDAISVQEVLEKTLTTFLRTEIKVTGAGRTDTGVHAKQLFAHVDMEKVIDLNTMQHRLNSFLPKDISIQDIFPVQDDAHARFDATAREYEYHISLKKDVFDHEYSYLVHQKPDLTLMNEGAKILLGHQDFQCFSRSKTDVKTYYCDIKKAIWEERGDALVFIIQADRFLRNMVRAVVGTLLEIGYGKLPVNELKTILDSKNRSNAGASAPAHGLYLAKVIYPKTIRL
ncbi:MAG: tRNA pseudouridine(38-40) synthase TruA [Bacteroidetes bacterium]|nr:tRNA pseudouridine(38-40) synthase TruA [Bacteroidota bacterium]